MEKSRASTIRGVRSGGSSARYVGQTVALAAARRLDQRAHGRPIDRKPIRGAWILASRGL
jgi:hypothetical protein